MTVAVRAGYPLIVPYGEERIRCSVRTSAARKRPSIAIHVEPDGRVLVDAPMLASKAQVQQALVRRAGWIYQQVCRIAERRRHVLPREYVSGEAAYYLGRRYCLKVVAGAARDEVVLRGNYLHVAVRGCGPDGVRFAMHSWYRTRARTMFEERLAVVCSRLRWTGRLPRMLLRTMRARWGSCSPAGRLTLNPALIRAPRECIDYVIVHELCHLRVLDHSPRFYRLLDTSLPGWRRVKARLDGMAEAILAS